MSTDTEERVKAHPLDAPDTEVSVRETFGLDSDIKVPAFSEGSD